MSKRTKTILIAVDLLTLVFVIVHIQSAIAGYIHYSNLPSWPRNIFTKSIKKYVGYGMANILNAHFGNFIKWMKIFSFFANIYSFPICTVLSMQSSDGLRSDHGYLLGYIRTQFPLLSPFSLSLEFSIQSLSFLFFLYILSYRIRNDQNIDSTLEILTVNMEIVLYFT